MREITFLVHKAEESGYYAEGAGVGIFAEGDTVEALKENIKGGIECFISANGRCTRIRAFTLKGSAF